MEFYTCKPNLKRTTDVDKEILLAVIDNQIVPFRPSEAAEKTFGNNNILRTQFPSEILPAVKITHKSI
jgi:hypothetical protein